MTREDFIKIRRVTLIIIVLGLIWGVLTMIVLAKAYGQTTTIISPNGQPTFVMPNGRGAVIIPPSGAPTFVMPPPPMPAMPAPLPLPVPLPVPLP